MLGTLGNEFTVKKENGLIVFQIKHTHNEFITIPAPPPPPPPPAPPRRRRFFSTKFFLSRVTVNVLHLVFQEFNYPEMFEKNLPLKLRKNEKKRRQFVDDIQPLHTNRR